MKIEVLATPELVARKAASIMADEARSSVSARGRFVLGISGGQLTPAVLREFARQDVPWDRIDIVQVDERIAPRGHTDRNLTAQLDALHDAPLEPGRIHPMPVEESDLTAAARSYSALLHRLAGANGVLDLAHLGLGPDGHTASLVPGDRVLGVSDADIALTGEYKGRCRMTMTYPLLNRSRRILWVVAGGEKAAPLSRLQRGDPSIPAGRIQSANALVIADAEAARLLPAT